MNTPRLTPGTSIRKSCFLLGSLLLFSLMIGLHPVESANTSRPNVLPLLEVPDASWQPVLMTYERGNHAVRSDRYRYIRYAEGAEELYDTENDPHEWRNIADAPGSRAIMDELARWLPEKNAEPAEATIN